MKEMNGTDWLRIAGKAILILLPFALLWAYIWFRPMAYADREQVAFLWNHNFINTHHDAGYNVVCLGDSVASSAYAPEVLSEKTVNLALPGQSPVEQYYILKTYLKHNPPPKVCYITFADFHLRTMESSFYWRTLYSHVLDFEDEREIYRAAEHWDEKIVLKDNYQKEWIAYRARFLDKYLPALLKSVASDRLKPNWESYETLSRHKGTYYTRGVKTYCRQITESKPADFKMERMTEEYYKKLLELCSEHRIQVRIIHIPRLDVIYSEKLLQSFRACDGKWKNSGARVSAEWLGGTLTAEEYADKWHLNNHGSYKFSKRIKAMYPEDFADDTPVSRATVEGILDYIRMENRPDMLLKWIEGKPLTAVCFIRRPDAVLADKALADTLRALPPGAAAEAFSASGTRCLVLRGDGVPPALSADADTFTLAHPAFCAPITFTDHTYTLSAVLPGEKGPRPVVRSNATAFSAVILDDQTGRVAAIKNFFPLYGTCTLMQD